MLHLGPERCRFRFFGLPKNTKNLGDVCALHLSEASVLEERPQVRFLHRQNEADWGSSEQIQRVKSQKALKNRCSVLYVSGRFACFQIRKSEFGKGQSLLCVVCGGLWVC